MTRVDSWHPPPENMALGTQEVHVWRALLDRDKFSVRSLAQTLAVDELARAERFHFQQDRERFIVRRGLLRAILGRYLSTEPVQLQFCYNPYGKPRLASDRGGKSLCFNISHSHGFVLYAMACDRQIGVDLEYMRPNHANDEIAERFFSRREVAALRSLPASRQGRALFSCWTRKEAYIKATDRGFSLPLDQFEVSLKPEEPASLLSTSWRRAEASRWSLNDLHPASRYAAALCVEGHGWQLRCWQWPKEGYIAQWPTDFWSPWVLGPCCFGISQT